MIDMEEMRRDILEKMEKINISLQKDNVKSEGFGRLELSFLIEEIRAFNNEYNERFYNGVIGHLNRILEILNRMGKGKSSYDDNYELEFLLKGFQTEIVKNEMNVKRYSNSNKAMLYSMIDIFRKENRDEKKE